MSALAPELPGADALIELDLFENAKETPWRSLLDNACSSDKLQKILTGSVHDRDLDIVELDEAIVDAAAAQRREKMLAR